MLTHKSVLVPSAYYHLRNQGVGREKLFIIEENYSYFLGLFRKYILPVAEVFCFTLLPDRFEFFIRIRDPYVLYIQMIKLKYRHLHVKDILHIFLLQQFSNFFNAYTKAFNKQQHRQGRLFIEPFSRKALEAPQYFTHLILNIHALPVNHGYCMKISEWPFTSYHQLINKKICWMEERKVIEWFGSLDEFIHSHQEISRPLREATYFNFVVP